MDNEFDHLQMDMAIWIRAKMWDGHEADCPAFGFSGGKCACIKSTVERWGAMRRDMVNAEPLGLPNLVPRMMALQAENTDLRHKLSMARRGLMVLMEDGQ